MPKPASSVMLRQLGSEDGNDPNSPWELICRDGWEWRTSGPGQVAARVAVLSSVQAPVVAEWIEKLRDPATWWAVSRELAAADSSPDVSAALRMSPWLSQVLPVLLEASVEGAPPPPPASVPRRDI